MREVILPEWMQMVLSQTKHNGMQLHFSERLKARVYKAYLDCISQALYIELLGTLVNNPHYIDRNHQTIHSINIIRSYHDYTKRT